MKLVTCQTAEGPRIAALGDGQIVDLNRTDPGLPCCMRALLAQGPEGLDRAASAARKGQSVPLGRVKLLSPIPHPGKVICVGLNYADHAKEGGMAVPEEPMIFSKFATTIRADGDPVVLPRSSPQVDYEAELVVVIGRPGRHIPQEEAMRHVAGYCCGNDISARDWQFGKPGGQWLLGKTFDSFAPLGPALVTAEEVPQPGNLRIQMRLNGKTMQDSNTSQLIFPVEKLISYVSGVCTLEPGDVIFTGTPPGVGCSRKPPVFLRPGDNLEVEIERLGVLHNPVVEEAVCF
jgi:2-keto-4-pentenoate hydratase/2-oxohepta-3-ene-1,7-dioic acid hydratase in catechol pathway